MYRKHLSAFALTLGSRNIKNNTQAIKTEPKPYSDYFKIFYCLAHILLGRHCFCLLPKIVESLQSQW